MSRVGLGQSHRARYNGGSADDSEDSDARRKRRKPNPWHQPQHFGDSDGLVSTGPSKEMQPSSFAERMMANMGYVKGQGLGATGKGRLAPIETQLRPQGAGLGAVKEKSKQAKVEEKREAAFRGEVLIDSSDEERQRKKERRERTKAAGVDFALSRGRKVKPSYRTAAEIEASAEGLHIPNVLKSIIDVSGEETRLLTSAAGLMKPSGMMVPAETEIIKLSRLAQRESSAFAEEWRALQERKEFFDLQCTEIENKLQQSSGDLQDIQGLADALENLQTFTTDDWTSVKHAILALEKSNGLSIDVQEIAVAAISPLFRTAMEEWNPLSDPYESVSQLLEIREILQRPASMGHDLVAVKNGAMMPHTRSVTKLTTPYESMIYLLWVPPVKHAISHCDILDCPNLLTLIDVWQPLLPPFVLANIVDALIAGRLSAALAIWTPQSGKTQSHNKRTSRSPVEWLFPWFQYLDEQHTDSKSSTGLMHEVRKRLKFILSSWKMSNGLIPDLAEWVPIFSISQDFSHLLVRYTLPRLSAYMLTELVIDPSNQDLTPMNNILAWCRPPFFSLSTIAQLFTSVYFPKFHHTLYLWLISPEAKHHEIMQWYQWWKTFLDTQLTPAFPQPLSTTTEQTSTPTSFNEHPIVAPQWSKALEIINIALDIIESADVIVPMSQHDQIAKALQPILFPKSRDTDSTTDTNTTSAHTKERVTIIETTFKDILEEWCAEQGLLLIPLREAELSSGLALFRVTASATGRGGVVVYIKGDVLWVRQGKDDTSFMPMELGDGLIARAERR